MNQTHEIVGQDAALKLIELAAELNEAVLLIGDTGTGKTTIIKNVADKMDRDWLRFNLTGDTTVDEFVGKYTLQDGQTKWQDGILLAAMKQGKWLICDEINAALPEILFVLHSLLDDDRSVTLVNHDGQTVIPHENFRFFATMNPVDEYAGTKELNKAFRSRFGFTIQVKTPPGEVEAKLIDDRTGVGIINAKKLVLVAEALRKMKAARKIFLTVSTRDVLQWAKVSLKSNAAVAFEVTILNKCDDEDERRVILDAVKKIMAEISQLEQMGGSKALDLNELKAEGIRVQRMVDELRNAAQQKQADREEQGENGKGKKPSPIEKMLMDKAEKEMLDRIAKANTISDLQKIRDEMDQLKNGRKQEGQQGESNGKGKKPQPGSGTPKQSSGSSSDGSGDGEGSDPMDGEGVEGEVQQGTKGGSGNPGDGDFEDIDAGTPPPPSIKSGKRMNVAVLE